MTERADRARLARRPAAITGLVAAIVLAAAAAVLVPWDWVPGGDLEPLAATEVFTRAEIARAEEYSSVRRYLGWASYAVSLLVALTLGLTAAGSRLLHRAQGRLRWWLAVPVGTLVLLMVGRLVTLPLSVMIHQRNRDYALSDQAWTGWFLDVARSVLVSWVLTTLLLLAVVAAARRSPRYWFAWAGGMAVLLTLGASFLYPVLVEPLFNRFTPMQAGPFKASVFALAERQGVRIDEVLVADASRRTTTLNAYVSGFGSTRRVVVYDNLLADLPPGQARVVISHELAHTENQDVLVGTSLGALGSVSGVCALALALDARWLQRRSGTEGAADPTALAAVLALVALGAAVSSPLQNTISRAVEVRADRESIAVTGSEDRFIEMQRELSTSALNDPTPPAWSQLWFGSHPTALQRAGLPASLRRAAQ
ncbi:MAG: Peptidase, M48 family [uncultured Nocardioidaceae bacterium]|uniref:Peptidase, M48 family n=1 Tax=uncultured Nocardioidaceae bacterium TaxID=253824 RepID=A0A6J4LJR9_9ACTN|nr:MAG: Peptidase, M48 family [uncultured Nocardioidaceae bacterium]